MTGERRASVHLPIVLVGFMAAGKSKIGRLLAERLGLPFIDVDKEIEAASGKSVAEIFSEDGEAEFRRAERAMISRVIERGAAVIAAGGGAFVDHDTREALNASTRTVWLDPPFDLILARLDRSNSRPLASGKSEEELRALWTERRPCYAEAHVRIETSDEDPASAVEQILAALGDSGV